ncbi:MAG: hypothetical protein R6T85_11700, partial [Egibacteraceae bacterium]
MYSTTQRPRCHPRPTGCRRPHTPAAAAVGLLAAEERAGYTAAEEPAAYTTAGGTDAGGAVSVEGLLADLAATLEQLAGLPLGGAVDDEGLCGVHAALAGLLSRVHRERLRALAEIDERAAYLAVGV